MRVQSGGSAAGVPLMPPPETTLPEKTAFRLAPLMSAPVSFVSTRVAPEKFASVGSMPEQILATVVDPDGRSVDLFEGRWARTVDGHPELGPYQNVSSRLCGHRLGAS